MLAAQNPPAGRIFQIVAQAARLAALAPVSAARRHRTRQVALPAVPHADRAVDETLDLGGRRTADRTDFVERQRPFQNHTCKARTRQKDRVVRRADRRLRRGVQFDGQRHTPQGHILHDERVDTRRNQLAGLPFGGGEFVVVKQRIERGVHPHAVEVCILYRPADVVDGVRGRMARTEPRTADIDRIGAGIDGRNRRSVVPRRGQQFESFQFHKAASHRLETRLRPSNSRIEVGKQSVRTGVFIAKIRISRGQKQILFVFCRGGVSKAQPKYE